MKIAIAASCAAALLLAAPAEAAPPLLDGVYDGTIGTLPVRMCFTADDEDGAYYYRSKLAAIKLVQSDAGPSVLTEGYPEGKQKLPTWTLKSGSGGTVAGDWSYKGKKLPIALKRIAATRDDDSGYCGSDAFMAPRLVGIRVTEAPATQAGVAVTRLSLDTAGHLPGMTVQSLRLNGTGPAVAKINAALRRNFDPKAHTWMDCVKSSLAGGPTGGEYSNVTTLRMATPRWISVQEHQEYFCDGAYPDEGTSYTLFDRTTGNPVDLFTWLTPAAVTREKSEGDGSYYYTVNDAFRDVLLRNWKSNSHDCADAAEQESSWIMELRPAGIAFTPDLPHVAHVCATPVLVSFKTLTPWLNATGKREVAALASR
jgi:hypothetical protein